MQIAVKHWQSEDEIKTELRQLTDATRKLRRDLEEMLRGSDVKPERRYLHRQAFPPAVVNDRPKRRKKAATTTMR